MVCALVLASCRREAGSWLGPTNCPLDWDQSCPTCSIDKLKDKVKAKQKDKYNKNNTKKRQIKRQTRAKWPFTWHTSVEHQKAPKGKQTIWHQEGKRIIWHQKANGQFRTEIRKRTVRHQHSKNGQCDICSIYSRKYFILSWNISNCWQNKFSKLSESVRLGAKLSAFNSCCPFVLC